MVDGQAYAVDGDGAFVGQVLGQSGGRHDAQQPALTDLLKAADMSHAIHMARDDVPTQSVVGAQGFFQIDGAGLVQAAGFVERLGRDVDGEVQAARGQGGDGHARAVEGDAVAQCDVVEVAVGRLDAKTLAVLG